MDRVRVVSLLLQPFVVDLQRMAARVAIDKHWHQRLAVPNRVEVNRVAGALAGDAVVALNPSTAAALCASLRLILVDIP